MLEIGILKGKSIEAVLDFAPHSTVVGIDTFQRIPPSQVPILKHPSVGWIKGSSLDEPSEDFEDIAPPDGFDIIIDDGLHTHDAQRITFENYFPYLNDNGVYFIEDVWAFDRMTDQQKQHSWLRKHPNDWTDEKYQKLLSAIEPHNVTFHDLRKGYYDDTFIIEVRK